MSKAQVEIGKARDWPVALLSLHSCKQNRMVT